MIREIHREPKIALCRACRGTGRGTEPFDRPGACEQCGGSGRVTVSCRMTLDIRPYHPKGQPTDR